MEKGSGKGVLNGTQNVFSDKAYAGVQEEFKKALADWEATTPAAKPIFLVKKKGRAGEGSE